MTPASTITLLLVDDLPSVRQGLRMRLALEPDLVIIGEAGDSEAAVTLARSLAPQVVIMDVEMPRVDGLAAARELRAVAPGSTVVVLSLHDDAQTRARAQAAGAKAFVAKHSPVEALLAAIRQAVQAPSS